jgi:hypothetical protein
LTKSVGLLLALLLFLNPSLKSQDRDTNYIEPYNKMITARGFVSGKYTIFALDGSQGVRTLQYRPNTRVNMGVGATYRALTLNLGFGLPNKDDFKGDTRYIDLQTHIYGKKWRYDFFGQFYRGYYVYPLGYGSADKALYYQRPDLNVQELGISAYHIYNNKKFSYRAAFLQSERQKQSAGSFLLGGGIIYGNTRADSAFVPSLLKDFYYQDSIRRLQYLEIGPGAGYAYTFVWKEHWFATGSLTLSADLSLVKESTRLESTTSLNISPNFLFRMGAGYNGDQWSYNFSWVTSRTTIAGQYKNGGYNTNTGNYRFTISKRFTPGKNLGKLLKLADNILDGDWR